MRYLGQQQLVRSKALQANDGEVVPALACQEQSLASTLTTAFADLNTANVFCYRPGKPVSEDKVHAICYTPL